MTVTAGNGHNSAARAMKNRLEQVGIECKLVDIVKEYTSSLNTWTIDKGYNLSVGYLRPIYDAFYKAYLVHDPKKASVAPTQKTVKKMNAALLKTIYDFKPDVIYGTSFYCGMALANLKRVYDIPAQVVCCMLDYVVSPFWESSIDSGAYLTITNDDFRQTLLDKGFSNDKLVSTGIPVDEKFLKFIDKREAREKLGLKQDVFTVFVFYGGGHWRGGYSVLKKLVKNFKRELQIVIVNGRDEKTKAKIDKEMSKYPSNITVKNIGFSKEVDLIMSAVDVMIGKGGGLSATEAVSKGLPLIATKKLPGQEFYNIKYLQEKGTALTFKNAKELLKHVNDIYDHPEKLKEMSMQLEGLKMEGMANVFNLIMGQKEVNYDGVDTNVDYSKVEKNVNKARKARYKELKKKK